MNSPLAHLAEITLVHPFLSAAGVQEACREAIAGGYYGIALPSSRIGQAYHFIEEADFKLTCLTGFPDGQAEADAQRFEIETAVDAGAHEFEVALDLSRLREGDYAYLLRALRDFAEAADERVVKVALDVQRLTPAEIETACRIVLDSGCQFLSVRTPGGSADMVRYTAEFRQRVGPQFGLKIHLAEPGLAEAVVHAGATRLGVSPPPG